ncbi:MAG: hypothetical protein OXF85_01155 [Candidatus Saccharibacteria bacterium]|nr:hypothetical protein [Candidatus Saccharibacteria bacterium]
MNRTTNKTIHELQPGEIIHVQSPASKLKLTSVDQTPKSSTSSQIIEKPFHASAIWEIPLKPTKKIIQPKIDVSQTAEEQTASTTKPKVRSRYISEKDLKENAITIGKTANNKEQTEDEHQLDEVQVDASGQSKTMSHPPLSTPFKSSTQKSIPVNSDFSTNQRTKNILNQQSLNTDNHLSPSTNFKNSEPHNSDTETTYSANQSVATSLPDNFSKNPQIKQSNPLSKPLSGSIPPPPIPKASNSTLSNFNLESLPPLDTSVMQAGQLAPVDSFNLAPSSAPAVSDVVGALAEKTFPVSDQTAPKPKLKRSFIIYSFLTALLVIGTIGLVIYLAWPRFQGLLQSQSSNHSQQLNDVLVNLLQVDNHNLQVDLRQENIQSIIPNSNPTSNLAKASATIDNNLKIQYPPQGDVPYLETQFKFDIISIQDDGQRSNLIINISTIYQPDGKAYFKLNSLVIDKQRLELSTDFSQRWSDLEALLKLQQQSDLDFNQNSQILNYVINFLRHYSAHQYIILLPSFNITTSQNYKQLQSLLQTTSAYELDEDSCQFITTSEVRCNLVIDYQKLYELYTQIYQEILQKPLPNYYQRLSKMQSDEFPLPNNFQVTFDKHTNLPITLVHHSEDNQNFHLRLDYDNYDDQTFDQRHIQDPLDIREYYQQVLDYESEFFNRN